MLYGEGKKACTALIELLRKAKESDESPGTYNEKKKLFRVVR